jgi:hypothetical protein
MYIYLYIYIDMYIYTDNKLKYNETRSLNITELNYLICVVCESAVLPL